MTSTTIAIERDSTQRELDGEKYLSYHVAGEGTGLLLLHGSGPGVSGWANFGGNLPQFATKYKVVVPDLPGYGASYRPDLPAPYLDLAIEAILRVLDAEGLDQVDIVGNSLGGAIATQFTLDHPTKVRSLVLMGPGGISPALFQPLPTEGIKLLVAFAEDPTRERLITWLQSMVGEQAFLTEELIEMRWQASQAPGAIEFIRDFMRMALGPGLAPNSAPMWTRLGEIAQRTLLVYGRDDRVTALEGAIHPMRHIPNAELHVFPKCGHWAMQERKDDFEAVVLDFLARTSAN